jgi:hypothetical protein
MLTEFWQNMDVTLRLPPYHPALNMTEKIWAVVKNWVAARNVTFNLHYSKKLAEERFSLVTREESVSVCNHVKEIDKNYIENERVLDDITDNLVINVGTFVKLLRTFARRALFLRHTP